MHFLGCLPLHCLEQLRIHGELEHCRRLRVSRELRVPDLVAPRTEVARLRHAPQKVRVAETTPFEEHGLVDHVRALAHRRDRGLASAHEPLRPRQRLVTRNLDDAQAVSSQFREKALLVLESTVRYPV